MGILEYGKCQSRFSDVWIFDASSDISAQSNGSAASSKERDNSEEGQANREHNKEGALIYDAPELKASKKADDKDNDMELDHQHGM